MLWDLNYIMSKKIIHSVTLVYLKTGSSAWRNVTFITSYKLFKIKKINDQVKNNHGITKFTKSFS